MCCSAVWIAACTWEASEDVGAERDGDTRSVCWRHRLLLMGTTAIRVRTCLGQSVECVLDLLSNHEFS